MAGDIFIILDADTLWVYNKWQKKITFFLYDSSVNFEEMYFLLIAIAIVLLAFYVFPQNLYKVHEKKKRFEYETR